VGKLILNSVKKRAYRLIAVQAVTAMVASLVSLFFGGWHYAEALLIGAAVYIIPGVCYAAQLFANLSSHALKRIMMIFYFGEILKLLVSVCAFVLIFKMMTLPLIPYFLGYLIAAVSFCVAPLFILPVPNSTRVVSE
jgi:ATP synthase protein I